MNYIFHNFHDFVRSVFKINCNNTTQMCVLLSNISRKIVRFGINRFKQPEMYTDILIKGNNKLHLKIIQFYSKSKSGSRILIRY